MRILLISPGSYEDIDSRITREIPYLFAKSLFSPHAVAAIAALTPREHDVEIHDEFSRGPVDAILKTGKYDIFGISVTSNQVKRSLLIASLCKKYAPSVLVVVGGIGVEHFIQQHHEDIDVVFHGEAEETWPRFLEDYNQGRFQKVYKNVSKPDMTKTPAPRWDLLSKDISSYTAVLVQTTRGCPFDCSFCDVIYTYGRKPRSKTIEQVLEEVRILSELKVKMIFIADDNFACDKKYTKDLLRRLIALNNSFKTPIEFLTQIDITIANDAEMLTLLADCNFQAVMIGIESVNEDSLKDYNKLQNFRIPVREAIHRIQSYGIVVLAHMIIGADSDDASTFQKTADFIADANIVHHLCHPLAAPPGTRMWYQLKREGRLVSTDLDAIHDNLDIISNIIPRQMTRVELFSGLADYWESIYSPYKFEQRAKSFIRGITYKPAIKEPGLAEVWALRKMLSRVITFFLFEAGKEHRKAFFSILGTAIRRGTYLLPKIIYLYTCYLVDYKRSMYDAVVARKYVQWEKDNPDKIIIEDPHTPVSENIREQASTIFTAAYSQVRLKISRKEKLYSTVVTAMIDYNDRFGGSLETFDQYHKDQLKNTCDRIIGTVEEITEDPSQELPTIPPAGFTREILDSLDNAVRYRDHHNGMN